MKRWVPLLLVGLGCGPVDLVVVSVPDGGVVQTTPCSDNEDCGDGRYCQKESCTAALGVCAAKPTLCTGDIQLECGCDGVTYGNDCLRAAAGAAGNDSHGECLQNAKQCETSAECPADAYCARLFRRTVECGPRPGRCFVLPDVACTGGMFPPFVPCLGPPVCRSWCDAVKSELPMAVPPRGTCP